MTIYEALKNIMDKNLNCFISGGVALEIQKVNIRRKPKDIDLYIPFEYEFKMPEGMRDCQIEGFEGSGADPDAIEMITYKYEGYKVDVFKPISPEFNLKFETYHAHPYKCLPREEIIKFKIKYAFDSSFSRWKHKDDIIHIMVNN